MASFPERSEPPSIHGFRVAGRPETFRVSSFQVREEVSRLYRADVQVTLDGVDAPLSASLLDLSATLVMVDGGRPARALHGIVARAETHGRFLDDRQALVLTIVPALWRLKRRRTRRIFQELTTLQIASRILDEWRVAFRFEVSRSLPLRGYCVQYDETDYAFLARLFAEDGLFFCLHHPLGAPHETLVVAEARDGYAPIDGGERLAFERMPEAGALEAREDHVTWFVPRERVRSTHARVRGYDFRRPDTLLGDEVSGLAGHTPVSVVGIPTPPEPLAELGDAVSSLAAHPPAGSGGTPTPPARVLYEHEGAYEDDLGPRPAAIRLSQGQRQAFVAEGRSFCRRLCPGRRFALQGHDLDRLDGAYVLTRVEHEGYAAEVVPPGKALYQNRFRAIPAHAEVRPSYRPPRPRQVAETAVVVGPPGQEIHTDLHGRVKVRFHWDLEARGDDRSSCWLRVAQAWAGTGWGAQFIPRVGMHCTVRTTRAPTTSPTSAA